MGRHLPDQARLGVVGTSAVSETARSELREDHSDGGWHLSRATAAPAHRACFVTAVVGVAVGALHGSGEQAGHVKSSLTSWG